MIESSIHPFTLSDDAKRSWLATARATAVVAGVFSALLAAFMLVHSFRSQAEDMRKADKLAELKSALRKDPLNEALMGRIRELDLRLRQDFFRRSDALAAGRWLLLAGVAVFLIALKSAGTLSKKLPMPKAAMPDPGAWGRVRRVARWAIAIAGTILALIGASLAFTSSSVFSRREAAEEAAAYPSDEEVARNWPGFRGPGGLGVSAHKNVPTGWDGTTGAGILWKAEVPLGGPSSPVLWADRVFLTGSSKAKLEVYCFELATGKLLWQQEAAGIPGSPAERPKVMEGVEWAPSTPATDGTRVYAIFATGDAIAFDFSGKRVWARNLGTPANNYGHAASLALWRNLLIIQYDQGSPDDKKSKLIALDAATGRTAWEARRETGQTWATPIVVKTPTGDQIIACGDPHLCGYDPASGRELWRAECLGGEIAPSPVYANGVAYTANAGSYASAVRTDGQGDVTKSHLLWKAEDGLPDVCSPLTNGELVWTLMSGGLLTCYDAKTGKRLWEWDFEENCESSPSLVGDKVMVVTDKGAAILMRTGREPEVADCATLGEKCRTSPAFLDGRLIIRGEKHLFCIGDRKGPGP